MAVFYNNWQEIAESCRVKLLIDISKKIFLLPLTLKIQAIVFAIHAEWN